METVFKRIAEEQITKKVREIAENKANYHWKRKRAKLNNDKITALYYRLSKDNGTNNESMNISTQKTMLKDYAKRNVFLNCQCSSQKTCRVWGGIILKRVHILRCFSPTIMYVTLLSMTAWTP